jgi:hypothetical protein
MRKKREGSLDRLAQLALLDETNFKILCALLISDVLEEETGFEKSHSGWNPGVPKIKNPG